MGAFTGSTVSDSISLGTDATYPLDQMRGGASQQIATNGITMPPTIINVLPAVFDVTFETAHLEALSFDISGMPSGCTVAIAVKLATRDETLTALDFGAAWCWPFDVQPDNSIGALNTSPVHVTLLPRGGWPPGTHSIQVMAGAKASHA